MVTVAVMVVVVVVSLLTYLRLQIVAAGRISRSIREAEALLDNYGAMHQEAVGLATKNFLRSGIGIENELLKISRLLGEKRSMLEKIESFRGAALLHPVARREVQRMLRNLLRSTDSPSRATWTKELDDHLRAITRHFNKRTGKTLRLGGPRHEKHRSAIFQAA